MGLSPNSPRQQLGSTSTPALCTEDGTEPEWLYKRTNADMDIAVEDRLIIKHIRLSLEAAFLQWIEEEKELSV